MSNKPRAVTSTDMFLEAILDELRGLREDLKGRTTAPAAVSVDQVAVNNVSGAAATVEQVPAEAEKRLEQMPVAPRMSETAEVPKRRAAKGR